MIANTVWSLIVSGRWGEVGDPESRAALIGPDETVQDAYDPYIFMRDAYLQNRDYLLNGSPEDGEFFEEDFEDF